MQILHVTLGFYPAQSWGGPVNIVYTNGKELIRRGHQVTVYCSNLLNKKQKIQSGTFEKEIDGMRVVYFNTLNMPWWPGTLGPIWLPDFHRYLDQEINKFDIVHINGYRSPMMASAANAARKAGIPIVTQPHGTLPIVISSFWIKGVYDRFWGKKELNSISALIALQERERQQALERGIPSHIIEVIPNGIDPHEKEGVSERGQFLQRFNVPPDKRVILFLGRINKIKGTDMLIEAFSQMKNPSALLVIAGPDDGQLADIKDIINRCGLVNRVIFTGLLTGKDVLAAFQDSDLFVMPSRADAFPVTIMQACLMDKPMVVTDCCEIANLVKDRVGDVVPFDAGKFSLAMERLLTDRERYTRYQVNCQEMIRDIFSISVVVDRIEAVYQRVIDRGNKCQ